ALLGPGAGAEGLLAEGVVMDRPRHAAVQDEPDRIRFDRLVVAEQWLGRSPVHHKPAIRVQAGKDTLNPAGRMTRTASPQNDHGVAGALPPRRFAQCLFRSVAV